MMMMIGKCILDHSNKKTQIINNLIIQQGFSTGGSNNENHTETQDNSKSFSQIYDEAISKIRGKNYQPKQ